MTTAELRSQWQKIRQEVPLWWAVKSHVGEALNKHGLVGGFKHFVIFPNSWDDIPIWLIFFRGVETTNQMVLVEMIFVEFREMSTEVFCSSQALRGKGAGSVLEFLCRLCDLGRGMGLERGFMDKIIVGYDEYIYIYINY